MNKEKAAGSGFKPISSRQSSNAAGIIFQVYEEVFAIVDVVITAGTYLCLQPLLSNRIRRGSVVPIDPSTVPDHS